MFKQLVVLNEFFLVTGHKSRDNPPAPKKAHYGGLIGPLATIACEPGQARKGAATACDLCAEMWLVRLPPNPLLCCFLKYKFA